MKVKFTLKIWLVFLFYCLNACDPNDGRMQVINNSNQSIAIEFSNDTISISKNKCEYYINNSISPNEYRSFLRRDKNGWLNFVRSSVNGKLNLFIYNVDSLNKYVDIDYMRENHIYPAAARILACGGVKQ